MSYRRGRFGGGSRFGGPKPVESGKEYDVQVTEISRKGDGVARIQGFIVFVKGGRVGQNDPQAWRHARRPAARRELPRAKPHGVPHISPPVARRRVRAIGW